VNFLVAVRTANRTVINAALLAWNLTIHFHELFAAYVFEFG
jgi:hypothetical protein